MTHDMLCDAIRVRENQAAHFFWGAVWNGGILSVDRLQRKSGGIDLTVRTSRWRNATVPGGLRIYAVGDIHGRADLLDAMIALIERNNAERDKARTHVIFLGDYIDRGPNSSGVIDRLLHGIPPQLEPLFLKGNHEDFLLEFLSDPLVGPIWLQNGGDATLASYGVQQGGFERNFLLKVSYFSKLALEFAEKLPPDHRAFYESLNLYFRFQDYFFVHAGIRPGVPLDRQSEEDLLWIRNEFLQWPHDFGAVVVHGHTPVAWPEDLENRIGIDTYAFQTGRLTAVGLEGSERWFLST
jgi:serine/threonine protein phosphatase 1